MGAMAGGDVGRDGSPGLGLAQASNSCSSTQPKSLVLRFDWAIGSGDVFTMNAPRRLFILLHREGFEALYQAASLALTVGSMGDEVTVMAFFGGLLTLCGKLPHTDDPAAVRSVSLGLPDPRHMLGEGRHAAGVRIVTCETAIRLAGLDLDTVRPYVDEIIGLATLWKRSEGAQILYI
jgi:peroxiredoxin family protein